MEQEKKKKTSNSSKPDHLPYNDRKNKGRRERHEEPIKIQKKIKAALFLN